jgi:hypothetical protein
MTMQPDRIDALREQIDKLLHVQFERGKYETHEFAKLHWDNKQSWPTVNNAVMDCIATYLEGADILPEKHIIPPLLRGRYDHASFENGLVTGNNNTRELIAANLAGVIESLRGMK